MDYMAQTSVHRWRMLVPVFGPVTQKPLRLVRRAVLASTVEGELLFDPFCGSGTMGVAAKELDRFFVGAETEREYAEMAERRIGAVVRGEVLRVLSSPARYPLRSLPSVSRPRRGSTWLGKGRLQVLAKDQR